MKQIIGLTVAIGMLASAALAGTDTHDPKDSKDAKDAKIIAPEPPPAPECNWTGFYVGLHAGGQFGHSAIHDFATGRVFGFDEGGFNGGLQLGYNFQWKWLVLGPEFDVGYMNVTGSGEEEHFNGVHGETDSDFYTTMRGRVGVTLNCHGCWLLYATGGAIGLNYTNRFHVDPDFFDARGNDFNWGWTVGGGIERKICPHWSVKAEYLYYSLDEQNFGNFGSGVTAQFRAETSGHILRLGLNYQF